MYTEVNVKNRFFPVFLLFVFVSGFGLFAQVSPSSGDSDETSHKALSWMVDEVSEMLVRELGGDRPPADVRVGAVVMNGEAVLLGEYLAASLPIRMSRRSGHRISVWSRPGEGFLILNGTVFRIGDSLNLFISLTDESAKVITGKELRLPMTPAIFELLAPAQYGASAADLYEPDSQLSPLAVMPGSELNGRTLYPEGDTDWFSFTLSEEENPSILTVMTAGDLDTYIEVYGNGNFSEPLAENDDSDDQNARVSIDIAPGDTVIVAVRGYDSSETGAYRLISRYEEFEAEASEPNNRMVDANPLEIDGGTGHYRIFPSGDVDWYRITIPRTQEESFLNLVTGGNLDTYMELYNEAGELLVSDDDGGGDVQARISYGPVNGNETYLLQVRHYEDGGTGEYTLSADFFVPVFDEFEPDNSREEASELEIPLPGRSVIRDHSFSTSGDTDWIVFTIKTATAVIFETEGPLDTYLTLYDENQQILQESDDDGDEYNARIAYTFSPGTYRLETRQYEEYPQEGAGYRLRVSAE